MKVNGAISDLLGRNYYYVNTENFYKNIHTTHVVVPLLKLPDCPVIERLQLTIPQSTCHI